jgi:hypothetical protein
MKKIVTLVSALFVLLACEKKEENETQQPVIVGFWEMTDLELSGQITILGQTIPVNGEGDKYAGGFDIRADNSTVYDASCDVIVNIPGIEPQNFPFERMGSGTWSLTNDNSELRIVESNGQTTIFPIKALTANIMIIEQDTSFSFMGNGATFEYEVTLEK